MPVHHRQIESTHRFSANRSSETPLPPRGPAFPATAGGTKGIPLPCPCCGLKQDSAVSLTWWVHEPSVRRLATGGQQNMCAVAAKVRCMWTLAEPRWQSTRSPDSEISTYCMGSAVIR